MSGEGHPADCPDCVQCVECENRAAWCLSEHPINRPCEHLEPICSDCWPGTCIPCRLAAERQMFETGEYDPRHDPFVDHTAAAKPAHDPGGHWKYGDVWVPNNPKEASA
jgi:hypothetical protein